MTSVPHISIKKIAIMLTVLLILMLLSGCNPEARGFALPPGDVAAGKATFVTLDCNYCHSISGQVEKRSDGHPDIEVVLGGPTTRVKTYGDLVTSIINPSHKISGPKPNPNTTDEFGESHMRIYNDIMSVQQMIDLTSYLQDSYQLVQPPYAPYYYGI